MAEFSTIELDVPDSRDYMHEELFGSVDIELPESVIYMPETIFNQSDDPITKMACSRFGCCHSINGQNRYVKSIDGMRYYELKPKDYWIIRIKERPQAKIEGDTLQSVLDQMLKLGLITGYSKVVGITDMKRALAKVRTLLSGSKKCDWKSVRDKHLYALGDGYAHIFGIVGYDKIGWIAINSYGPNNGMFHIPYEFTNSLFSVYALHDDRDAEVLEKYKKLL